MQTFLPHSNFAACAYTLDSKRLNKQRVECLQILRALMAAPGDYGWQHHPAVLMWRGHEYALCNYALDICNECDKRGIKDKKKLREMFLLLRASFENTGLPPWFYDERIFKSHRAMLYRKDPDQYEHFLRDAAHVKEYFWPTKNGY